MARYDLPTLSKFDYKNNHRKQNAAVVKARASLILLYYSLSVQTQTSTPITVMHKIPPETKPGGVE